MKKRVVMLICCAIAGAVSFAHATEKEVSTLEFYGSYRFRFTGLKEFFVSGDGDRTGRGNFGEMRLQLGLTSPVRGNVTFYGEFYFLEGLNFGDRLKAGAEFWDDVRNRRSPYLVTPRKFFLKVKTAYGVVEAGQMLSGWGLGIVANDGTGKHNLWGDAYYGDIVDRIVFVTKPFARSGTGVLADNLIAGVGADVVFRDDNGSLLDGDVPLEAILFALYRGEIITGGVYIAYRYQWFEGGDTLSVGAYDAYFYWRVKETEKWQLTLAGEAAVIEGKTDYLRTLGALKGVHLLGAGGVLRASASYKPIGATLVVEGGAASGDADPLDNHARVFTFDPDYNVGLIAYEEVMAAFSAASAERISNPQVVAQPPPGVDILATYGGVTNSTYFNATLLWEPVHDLKLKMGFLSVWLLAPLVDLYNSTVQGGVSVSPFGVINAGKHFGHEWDFGLSYTLNTDKHFAVTAGMESGMFVPGSALDASSDSPVGFPSQVYKSQLRLTLAW